MANSAMPAAQRSAPPVRRLIAVGITRHLGARTITVRATETGVTGIITSRCPFCHRPSEECRCTNALPAAPAAQTFDDDSDDACPLCLHWNCTCPTQTARQVPAVAA
ncbi:hypothetical protein [Streptomyces fulvorobeus]|uniref:Uncharacterized protein n=1 Tax=Streptomyces fulvorobeus TaxID=284028 RepID=A0A7J0C5P2_9ACTN|nr:hypothetical protein [Streptomyces fulvorobeus]NYE40714.1 hypothetical protein [Streptomyces fulvorobeus]GFM97016.1 hypothetical protein Sfulv_18270 [Streptomyces fulvorobeus]